LSEAIVGEVDRAKAEVMAEADLERETEGAAIIRIGVVGEEATKALVEMIRVSFENFANLIDFTFKTKEGQKQFILFIAGERKKRAINSVAQALLVSNASGRLCRRSNRIAHFYSLRSRGFILTVQPARD